MRPAANEANTELTGWRSTEHRKMMVKRMLEYLIKHGPSSWAQNIPTLMQSVEKFEEEAFVTSQVETEYIAKVTKITKAIKTPHQNTEQSLLAGNSSRSGEASMDWQEHLYQKAQMIKATYAAKLDHIYKQISAKLQRIQQESIPQQPKTSRMEKYENHMRAFESIFSLLNMEKNQITPSFEHKLDAAEKYIHNIIQHNSSHHQEQRFVDVPSMQQFVPSKASTNFHAKMSHKKPTSQVMNPLSSSHQVENQVSVRKVSGYGNSTQPHYDHGTRTTEAFDSSTSLISASTMVEDYANVNEQTLTLEDASPAMQRLIRALTSISDEAFMAAINDIEAVFHLNDDITMLEPLNKAISGSGTDLEGINLSDSQERYLNFPDLFPSEKKMNRFINSTPSSWSSVEFTSAEKPFSKSITSQEKSIFEEIKEINNKMIDTELVIDEGNTTPRVVKGAEEHGEGLVLKLLFNSVSVSLPPTSKYAFDKKSMVKPLHLLVPISYPHHSPVIIDEEPSEIRFGSKDLDDLLVKAKLKLKFSLCNKKQPLSLQVIATSWDSCVREAICEYAQLHGGGTFSSTYGGWEICPSSD